MIKTQYDTLITSNEDYEFPAREFSREYTVSLTGGFGGGTATLGWVSKSGAFVAYTTPIVPVTAEAGWIADLPFPGKFAIRLTGATNATLILTADVLP